MPRIVSGCAVDRVAVLPPVCVIAVTVWARRRGPARAAGLAAANGSGSRGGTPQAVGRRPSWTDAGRRRRCQSCSATAKRSVRSAAPAPVPAPRAQQPPPAAPGAWPAESPANGEGWGRGLLSASSVISARPVVDVLTPSVAVLALLDGERQFACRRRRAAATSPTIRRRRRPSCDHATRRGSRTRWTASSASAGGACATLLTSPMIELSAVTGNRSGAAAFLDRAHDVARKRPDALVAPWPGCVRSVSACRAAPR